MSPSRLYFRKLLSNVNTEIVDLGISWILVDQGDDWYKQADNRCYVIHQTHVF